MRHMTAPGVLTLVFLLTATGFQPSCHAHDAQPVRLTCEYGTNPVGIGISDPRLNWNIGTTRHNWIQSAYQVMVASDSLKLARNQADMWNTGKTSSRECLNIVYSGKPLVSLQKYWWKVRVWDSSGKGSDWSRLATWTMAMVDPRDWKGKWIASDLELTPLQKELRALPDFGMESESEMWSLNEQIRKRTGNITSAPAVYMRREFRSDKRVSRAVANICGLGLSELYINGEKVGDHLLDPAPSDYQKRIFYQTHDVTRFIRQGPNALGVMLGNGWFNLVIPHALRYYAADYIATPRLLFQLDLFYDDGSREIVVSDSSWKFTTDGPIRFNNLLSGETYDANRELPGWNQMGYNDSGWKSALPAEAPAGKPEAQYLNPVRIIDSVRAVSIQQVDGGYAIGLEKDITGWCRIRVSGNKGDTIIVKYPGMGTHTLGRYQTYEYILKGGKSETFAARFSYNGINKVEISGLRYEPDLRDITGIVVNTDFALTGRFSCSDSTFNTMYAILLHTMRNYVVHIPNDPVREKAGWTQDVETAFDVYAYSLDCRSMYVKWQRDFLDIIHENGYVPPVAPGRFDGPTINGPWWGGMIVYLPWKLYQQYADRRILEESYGAMKKYVGYLHTIDSNYIVPWGLGDWLEPGTEHDGARPKMTPVPVTSTIGFYLYADITARTAAILGFSEDLAHYSDLARRIKGAFNQRFFDPETGRYAKFSQASQVLPLRFGMVPEDKRQLVTRQLVEKIAAADNHPGTGFVSTPVFLASLSDLGLGELAYTVASQRTYPSWYDMVFNHGTKIFKEDWQGGMVQMPPLGGGLGYWFYYALAGIRPDTAVPGFRNIIIKPDMVSGLNWARGEYRSVYGVIRSEWKREGGRVTLEVEIPANTTATVWLPTNDPTQITESGHPVIAGKGCRSVQTENGSTILCVGSGTYIFTVASREMNRR